MYSILEKFRSLRRRIKGSLPYVRRRQYRILDRKYDALCRAMAAGFTPASAVELTEVKSPVLTAGQEVCLFVSYAAMPMLKPHVVDHMRYLMGSGVRVILILNTDLPAQDMIVDLALQDELTGIFVRTNVGFDFAAWSHIYRHCPALGQASRLYLTNDSIVGPLNGPDFERLITRVRASAADVIGLTECLAPTRHLQSFFLVFNASALQHRLVQNMLGGILNLESKTQVIDVYETHLTEVLEQNGLRCEALFPSLSNDHWSSNDVFLRWTELLELGFPYVKTSIVRSAPDRADVVARVPEIYRTGC